MEQMMKKKEIKSKDPLKTKVAFFFGDRSDAEALKAYEDANRHMKKMDLRLQIFKAGMKQIIKTK